MDGVRPERRAAGHRGGRAEARRTLGGSNRRRRIERSGEEELDAEVAGRLDARRRGWFGPREGRRGSRRGEGERRAARR